MSKGFIPFRYQGQYEDIETGLTYNRFRYYSPETGSYISQDPYELLGAKIGLKRGNWTLFFQANNLLDKVYASSYLIQDQVTPPPARMGMRVFNPRPTIADKTNFIPGVGRNFVGGITYTW